MSGCGCEECGGITLFKGDTGATGATGATGTTGANGALGEPGGFSSTWIFDAGTSANPIATEMRFNSATLSSVTEIYINDTNSASLDLDAFLDSFKNTISTVDYFGLVKVYKKTNSNIFWYGKITAAVDNGADHTFTVTHIQSNGTFVADDIIVVDFTPRGEASINTKIVEIGNWDMDTDATVSVAHGLTDISKIRSVSVIIRDDDSTVSIPLDAYASDGSQGGVNSVDVTNVVLRRKTGGMFDNTFYNNIVIRTRGYITIGYID